jgi:phosphoglycolate phosphatase
MITMNFLFDLDGTLTDPKEGIVRSVRFAMEEMGIPLDPELDLDWCIGPPLQKSLARLLGDGQSGRVSEALQHYRQRYQQTGMYENKPYAGIQGELEALMQKAELYVATSKPTVFAGEILRHFGLSKYFVGIYGSELDGKNSDKAELIAKILSERKLPAGLTSMVGDREHDMIGAAKNKVRGIGVLWGYGSREELVSSGASILLQNPSDLSQLGS